MRRSKAFFGWLTTWLLLSVLGVGILGGARLSVRAAPRQQAQTGDVVINEVAWGGTLASDEDEWIELYNYGPETSLDNWVITSAPIDQANPNIYIVISDGNPFASGEYYLLEREFNTVVNNIVADQIYFGPGNLLDDDGQKLYLYAPNPSSSTGYDLIDTVNDNGGQWPAGLPAGYGSMERFYSMNYQSNDNMWVTNDNEDPIAVDFRGTPIFGTPRSRNRAFDNTFVNIISDTPDPSIPDSPVKVTVSVKGGTTIPTGTVKITGGTGCTISLSSNSNGLGSCNVRFSSTGPKTIIAEYSSTSGHDSETDTESHEVITGINTTTTITDFDPEPGLVGEDIEVTVEVEPSTGSSYPTGSVSITGANSDCQLTLTNGVGSCNVRFNSIGVKTLTATYQGGGVFISSNDTATVDVFLASEVTITSDDPDPSNRNQAVSVDVTVTGDDEIPTGNVEITGATTNCTITLTDGSGSCNVSFSTSGTKTLRASYIGDDLYGPSSDTESHVVSFSSTGGSSSGSTGTVTLPPILGISEFLPRPGYDWNNDGIVDVFDEFIEIINAGQIDVNLSSYRLDDEENLGSVPYTLPSITLKPGERAVFYAAETGILLSDAGDTVRLLRGSTVVDAYTYGVVRYPDQSWCRIPDRLGYWNDPCFPTPGNPNALTGNFPLPPEGPTGYLPSVCLLPDTTPKVFVYAECEVGGDKIWNRRYWDEEDDAKPVKLEEPQKWETVFK
ncbi:MAG: Ig-like domain repeat protein [Anaerolineales bacterium]